MTSPALSAPQRSPRRHPRWIHLTIATFVVSPALLISYKLWGMDYSLSDILPRTRYHLSYEIGLDGHDGNVRVRTFLPLSDERQTLAEEEESSAHAVHFRADTEGINRVGVWSGSRVSDGTQLHYAVSVVAQGVRYQLDSELSVPRRYPDSVLPQLRPEPDIQVDAPEIAATLATIGADRGPLRDRLQRIFDFTSSLPQRPFKGTTDALTALRLGEASCNGKSRLFVALARAAGIPARLVGGLILEAGRKRTSHQWVEVYVGGHWVPFCPTNGYFAELPERYLTLYRGDEALFRHTADINFDYGFRATTTLIPSPRARASFRVFNVWGLFDRLGLPFSLLRTVLMLPIGALIVVLFRNVIGLPTFGTFLPALIAAAAGETGLCWGVVGLLLVMALVALARWTLQRLELLHSPTLAILLAAVVITMLTVSLLAERVGLGGLARLSFFPIAVLAIASERFYLALAERDKLSAMKELAGTLVVVACCYVLMSSLALQILLIGFPEILLFVVAANIYLGRWVGVRVSEYLRFRPAMRLEEVRQ
ncbi:7TM domain-containing protein [Haliangium sp.]|uniref:7TM domain-containing protein n=1 Tax=Haliangium sp. TaxID=2663208 RepID=UPI003D12008F